VTLDQTHIVSFLTLTRAPPGAAVTTQTAPVGGSVPATLALTIGGPTTFGAFTPGVGRDYATTMAANVVSSAGDAALTVADPSATAPGRLTNGSFTLAQPLRAKATSGAGTGGAFAALGGTPTQLLSYSAPVANDSVGIDFSQSIGAAEPLRTGSYSKTLTLTLSTTNP
jgi:hypothetical protein